MNEGTNEQTKESTQEKMNEWTHENTDGRTNEQTHEWTHERSTPVLNSSFEQEEVTNKLYQTNTGGK